MQKLLRLSRLLDALSEKVGRFTYGFTLVMIFLGVWNVVGRYLGRLIGQNLSSNALIEGQWYIFDLLFLLGGAYALKHDEHVRVDVFYSRWSPKWKALVDFLGTLLFLIPFCAIIIAFSWNAIVESWRIWEISPDPGGLPRYPIKTMIIVSFALLILQGISQAIKNWAIFTGQLRPQEEKHDAGV
jgi:TRAP-type mannitol/chloroaromatic compound transport system permease small subunit